jgi:hypothetical protein
MSKRQITPVAIAIDQEYENQIDALADLNGHVSDYPGDYEIEPVYPQPPKTWTPAQSPQQALQTQRQQTIGQLRQIIDDQGQEPPQMATGHRFVINETTNAKDRAGAGFRWWLMLGGSLAPLGLGLALWWWEWIGAAFFFIFVGGGMLIATVTLNRQAHRNSPIRIEQGQRDKDHEYRMFKEQNAQRTRELVIAGFLGQARADIKRNAQTLDGQALLVDSENGVQQ